MIDFQNCKYAHVLAPISVAGGATATTTEVDTKGFRYAVYLVQAGLIPSTGFATLKLQEGDTSGSLSDVTGGALTALVDADDGKISAIFVDLRYRKRYQNLVLTNGATNASLMAATVILWRAEEFPDSLTERGLLQQIFV